MTTVLSCIYALGMLFFSVAFLVDWIRSRKEIRKYFKFGIWAGVLVVSLDVLAVIVSPSTWTLMLLLGLVLEAIIFIRVLGFTMLGMHYCTALGYPSFPVLLGKFGSPPLDASSASPISTSTPLVAGSDSSPGTITDTASPASTASGASLSPVVVERAPVLLDVSWRKYLATSLAVAVIGILYSIGLFVLTKPQMSEIVQRAFGVSSPQGGNSLSLQTAIFVLVFAVAEELFFRLGIQNFVAKHLRLPDKHYWIAIAASATLWTLGHAGTLDPEWVKLAQIFPMGLMLGWLCRKLGVESSILAHAVFNLALLLPASNLIR